MSLSFILICIRTVCSEIDINCLHPLSQITRGIESSIREPIRVDPVRNTTLQLGDFGSRKVGSSLIDLSRFEMDSDVDSWLESTSLKKQIRIYVHTAVVDTVQSPGRAILVYVALSY